jgi:hypothetical protein
MQAGEKPRVTPQHQSEKEVAAASNRRQFDKNRQDQVFKLLQQNSATTTKNFSI